jgi:autophagy-related protein 9
VSLLPRLPLSPPTLSHSPTSIGITLLCRFSGFTLFAFLAFAIYYIWQIIAFVSSIRGLLTIHRFYTHLLGVPDVRLFLLRKRGAFRLLKISILKLARYQADVQTISWPTIVHLIGQIRESNPLTSLSSRPALALAEGRTSSASPLKLDAHE